MRILTGIQPSGKLHIGNYFGSIKPAVELQEKGDAYIFIANYHAMTTVQDGPALLEMTKDVALDYLACGIDPEKTALYRQSDVPEVHELAWLLSVLCPMGLLERCHSYKDKMAKGFSPRRAPTSAAMSGFSTKSIRSKVPRRSLTSLWRSGRRSETAAAQMIASASARKSRTASRISSAVSTP